MSRMIKILLAVLSGVMLSLSWLGFPGWLLFAAFLPLLLLEDYFTENKPRKGYLSFWGYSLLTFLIWNVLTTWWIVHATLVGAFLAIAANSILMSFFLLAAHFVRRNTGTLTGYLAIIVLWITFEFCHFHWDIEWPWLMLGNGFANNVKLIQWYSVTGTLGGSVWVLLVNILLFTGMKRWVREGRTRNMLLTCSGIVLLVLVPVIISLAEYHSYQEISNSRKVLIIQPNIDPYSETFDEGALNDKLKKFIRLAESHMKPDVDFIIGPETVFEQDWNEEKLMEYPAVRQMNHLVRLGDRASLVVGASSYRFYPGTERPTQTAHRTANGIFYDVYNTAILLDGTDQLQTYHKSILVPGVEKMPFRKYLKFLDFLIINLGGTSGSLGIQPDPVNFVSRRGDKIAPAICYESVFGEYLGKFVQKGAGVIFIITNDGWWKNTPGYRQHFSFARLRAVELRRSIARSANTGISGIINQRGDIVLNSRWWVEDALTGELNLNEKITFYAKYGDYLGRLSAFISVVILLTLLSVKIMKTIKKPHQF